MTAAAVTDNFDIARVVSRAFEIIGRNLLLLVALTLILYGLPKAGASMLSVATNDMPAFPGAIFGLTGTVYALLAGLGYVALQATVVHVVVSDMNGRRPYIMDVLRLALRRFGPLLAVVILAVLGIAAGFIALVVPGLMLMTAWAVVVPAAVVERAGVKGAFTRSLWLTRGFRWPIFAMILVFIVVSAVLQGAISGLQGGIFGLMHGLGPIPELAQRMTGDLFDAIFALIGSVLVVSIYYELRAIKEDAGPADLDEELA